MKRIVKSFDAYSLSYLCDLCGSILPDSLNHATIWFGSTPKSNPLLPRFFMLVYLFLLLPYQQTDVTVLKQVFLDNNRAGFAELLPQDSRVTVKLTPLLFDTGHLQAQQVLLAFDKLQHRFRILDIQTISSQSDANYAWLEIYLKRAFEVMAIANLEDDTNWRGQHYRPTDYVVTTGKEVRKQVHCRAWRTTVSRLSSAMVKGLGGFDWSRLLRKFGRQVEHGGQYRPVAWPHLLRVEPRVVQQGFVCHITYPFAHITICIGGLAPTCKSSDSRGCDSNCNSGTEVVVHTPRQAGSIPPSIAYALGRNSWAPPFPPDWAMDSSLRREVR